MSIREYRTAIDRIDLRILELLSKRAREVKKIGKLKHDHNHTIRDPKRESELLDRLKSVNPGPYPDLAIEAIYREIISASLALESPFKVAYLGPATTFSHQAALLAFGQSVQLAPQPELRQVFEEVSKKMATYGVVPIENSLEGVVHHSLDLLMSHEMRICGEIVLPIRHCLLSHSAHPAKIKKVYSHAQPWGQCGLWLKSHGFDYRHFEEVSSTAKAAELASRDPESAAIASREAAQAFGIPIVKADIQDSENNQTRFWMIGFDEPGRTGNDKTTIVFQAHHRVGLLAQVLSVLARAKINLTKIESRPSRVKNWEYMFYADMEGHFSEKRVAKALETVKSKCNTFRHLGSYPRYEPIKD